MRDNIQRIEVDYNTRVIKCGDLFTLDYYVDNIDWRYLSFKCGFTNNIWSGRTQYKRNGKLYTRKSTGTEQNNKKLSEMLGMPPSLYAKMLKNIMFKLWIAPNKELMFKLCGRHYKSNHSFNPALVHKFYENIDQINQFKADGNENLMPFLLRFEKDTKQLKELFGKSNWKTICKNSLTRNTLISEQLLKYYSLEGYKNCPIFKLSSSILKKKSLVFNDSVVFVDNFLRSKRALTTDKYNFTTLMNLSADTYRMSKRIGKTFDTKWPLDKLQEKHDEYYKKLQEDRHPDVVFPVLGSFKCRKFNRYDYTGYLLDTPYKINIQGQMQHHCVGSYIYQVQRGEYLVYDIKDDNTGLTISTLGIYRDGDVWLYSQHYGPCNSQVTESLDKFAKELIRWLNIKNH